MDEYIIVQKNGNIYISSIDSSIEKREKTEPKIFEYKGVRQYVWDDKKYKYHATLSLLFLLSFLLTFFVIRDITKSLVVWIIFTTVGVFVSRYLSD